MCPSVGIASPARSYSKRSLGYYRIIRKAYNYLDALKRRGYNPRQRRWGRCSLTNCPHIFGLYYNIYRACRTFESSSSLIILPRREGRRDVRAGRYRLPVAYISMPQGTPHPTVIPFLKVYSKVYNYLDTVGRGYKPRQRGWGGAATQKDRCVLSSHLTSETDISFLSSLVNSVFFFASRSDF